ncbi:conserved hypothetical protein [Catenulispora acidiphila DSM 44928]|uniref:Uncharacterized protein n=1 Tax=Catenulispora acidiphila (strain DSM 44928 / JCM 14897 / NBRC 102108 / NRRL B-24433 / ID139908) TaxID=479433 RepID=C7QHH5_CATAD|nr:hypothetical protein [Catenulispora acidiphila]ACU69114.1 conserved hypothetical protein [Catenulispora acidiphila DSM 44928]
MTLNGFAYGELSFGADGQPADPTQRGAAPAVALGADVTDLLVLSHGWLDDPPRAQILYAGLTEAIVQAGGAPPGLAVLGILWPSKRFDAEPEVQVAATVAATDPSGRAAESFVTRVRHRVGAQLELLPVTAEYANPGDHQATFFGLEPRALLEKFGSIEDGIDAVLNLSTYYEMKGRAGAVGKGLVPVLAAVREARPEVRLHLAGHSFGARVMASALANCEAFPVSSVTLIQGAFSQFGFAKQWDGVHDGLFRPGLFGGRLKGPVVVTHSRHDHMVGLAYELASRMAGDQPDTTGMAGHVHVHDEYGAIGSHGALSTPESVWGTMLPVQGAGYAFPAGAISNLDGNAYIPNHYHVMTPEMGKVLVAAMTACEAEYGVAEAS